VDVDGDLLARRDDVALGLDDDQHLAVDGRELVGEGLGVAQVVEDAVELPLDVGELREDVAGHPLVRAHLLDDALE